jgi:environmental stress-induced protein Ves
MQPAPPRDSCPGRRIGKIKIEGTKDEVKDYKVMYRRRRMRMRMRRKKKRKERKRKTT